ncbi:RagB/SusD family nutrient uptake outer membrane protein [Paraflavitalea speifideaquila]|uniref:RagB/SusD family nutrient uptake outer membrane protein n=1 Tax=Paraflavitalea speifideaquila TaxID=3076558 RepID=UPI0028E25B42|nr:RagB/SusD family nutrient uptake outer membrane protein [Paraflavitalea speifideiaquila]
MTVAEAALPTPLQVGTAAGIRVTNTVAEGILARVCLTMAGEPLKDASKYADAKMWAAKVINSGFHSLNPDYRQVFINHCADVIEPKECLWEAEFYRTPSNGSEWGTNGATNSINFRNIDYGLSYGQYALTKKYWDLVNLTPNDLRRDWNMAPFALSGAQTGTTGIIKTAIGTTTANIWSRYEGKWRREFETYTPKASGATSINWPILRYADVLLMYAEAENELNGATADAYNAINLVRERAQGKGYRITGFTITNAGSGYTSAPAITVPSPTQGNGATATATISGGKIIAVTINNIGGNGAFYTSAPTITLTGGNGIGAVIAATLESIVPTSADLIAGLSQEAFRQAVRDERAVELAGEALRKHDLIRWGTLVSSMKALSAYIRADAGVISGFQYVAIPGDNVSSRDIFCRYRRQS